MTFTTESQRKDYGIDWTIRTSINAFNVFPKYIDQFEGITQTSNIVPTVGNQLMEGFHIDISKANMNDSWWWFGKHDSV